MADSAWAILHRAEREILSRRQDRRTDRVVAEQIVRNRMQIQNAVEHVHSPEIQDYMVSITAETPKIEVSGASRGQSGAVQALPGGH